MSKKSVFVRNNFNPFIETTFDVLFVVFIFHDIFRFVEKASSGDLKFLLNLLGFLWRMAIVCVFAD